MKRKPKIELPYEIQQAQMNLFDEQNDMFGDPWSEDFNNGSFCKSIKTMISEVQELENF